MTVGDNRYWEHHFANLQNCAPIDQIRPPKMLKVSIRSLPSVGSGRHVIPLPKPAHPAPASGPRLNQAALSLVTSTTIEASCLPIFWTSAVRSMSRDTSLVRIRVCSIALSSAKVQSEVNGEQVQEGKEGRRHSAFSVLGPAGLWPSLDDKCQHSTCDDCNECQHREPAWKGRDTPLSCDAAKNKWSKMAGKTSDVARLKVWSQPNTQSGPGFWGRIGLSQRLK